MELLIVQQGCIFKVLNGRKLHLSTKKYDMKRMIQKASLAAVLGLAVMGNVACTKLLPKDLSFNMDGSEFTITVPPTSQTGEVDFTNRDADINIDSAIQAHTAEIYALKSVKLTSLQLSIENPAEQTFDPVKNVSGYISAPAMTEQRVAHKEGIQKGLRVLDLDVDDVELASYLKQGNTQFRLHGTVVEPTTQPVVIHVKSTYHVVAEKDVQ